MIINFKEKFNIDNSGDFRGYGEGTVEISDGNDYVILSWTENPSDFMQGTYNTVSPYEDPYTFMKDVMFAMDIKNVDMEVEYEEGE